MSQIWIISRLVVVNEGKINGLSPIEQALSQRVQGVEDSRTQVNYYKYYKGLKLFRKSYELCLEI